ncbi:MAG: glycoside hydrolase family 88 protein, partial [Bacteroidetes bacterium]|nr:glycoside hydrolase family 88 protein [Bacteroidota bacterium]
SKKGFDANAEIYDNELHNIRDNDFEPEHYAYNMHIYHNRSYNIHKTMSVDGTGGGYIYYYGNIVSMDSSEWAKKICTGFWKIYAGEDSLEYPMYAFNNSFSGYGKAFNVMEGHARMLKHYNNAYHFAGPGDWVMNLPDKTNDFDYDMSNRPWSATMRTAGFEKHGKIADPLYDDAHSLTLSKKSPAIDAGKIMSFPELGWKQTYKGKAPDIGAYDNRELVDGPPFRFRMPPGAAFSYKERPRIVRYKKAGNTLTLWFSAPLNPATVHASAIHIVENGSDIAVRKCSFPHNPYELVMEMEGAAFIDFAIAFDTLPVGSNGQPVTYWASALRMIPPSAIHSVSPRRIAPMKPIVKDALQTADKIVHKLITDSRFALKSLPQKEELGVQIIDLRGRTTKAAPVTYAIRQAKANTDTLIHMDISGGGRISVWLNRRLIFRSDLTRLVAPREFAYGRFTFTTGFDALFTKGDNELIIRHEATAATPVILLRPQLPNGDLNTAVSFNTGSSFPSWYLTGPFGIKDSSLPSGNSWQKPAPHILRELIIDSSATYQRDPYADWHYANGNTVWSVMNLAMLTGDTMYLDYVKNYTGFLSSQLSYFRYQYDSLFAFRGSYHRLFRLSMLDDAGSAVLPFMDLYLAQKTNATKTSPAAQDIVLRQIINPIAAYITTRQSRLKDGTFCRPEPVEMTVWADDLFMSVPFLLRMGSITGNQKYYEEAARQFTLFRRHLLDTANGLYRHGWFSATQSPSAVCWGRANGWIAWATLELLTWLPHSHTSYQSILQSFRQQMATLVKYQSPSGMWRQVLDKPDAWEETSCSAIFTLALARGVAYGWIDKSYRENALKAWQAIRKKIDADGTVHGICRGTEIGPDIQFYLDRKTIDQDPRGLGAVITAAMEIAKMESVN